MERYTKDQRIIIIQTYYKHGQSYAETVRKLRGILGRKNAPNQSTVQRLIKKFEHTGSLMDIKVIQRHRSGRSFENISAVAKSVEINPGLSITKRAKELGIAKSTLHRILQDDLNLKSHKLGTINNIKYSSKENIFPKWTDKIEEKTPKTTLESDSDSPNENILENFFDINNTEKCNENDEK